MITEAFDESPEILCPERLTVSDLPKIILAAFTEDFIELVTGKYPCEKAAVLDAGCKIPVYAFDYKGTRLGIFRSIIGAAGTVGMLEEITAMGAEKMIYFGSCGSLDKDITSGRLIVPTEAFRDEGTSYHYLPPSDSVCVETAERLAEIFDEIGAPYVKTKTWTTDAVYRETRDKAAGFRAKGCSAVEMECAGIMAAARFRGLNVYQFFYAADCLDGDKWDKRILGNVPDDLRERIFWAAAEAAVRI